MAGENSQRILPYLSQKQANCVSNAFRKEVDYNNLTNKVNEEVGEKK